MSGDLERAAVELHDDPEVRLVDAKVEEVRHAAVVLVLVEDRDLREYVMQHAPAVHIHISVMKRYHIASSDDHTLFFFSFFE
jgi:hypothetical protein